MTVEMLQKTLHMLSTTTEYDSWMRTILFFAVIIGAITIIGIMKFFKKINEDSFFYIYSCLIFGSTALVFAEREVQKQVSMNQIETFHYLSFFLWWITILNIILLIMWFLRSLYTTFWSKKAYRFQMLFIGLLAIFQPSFFDKCDKVVMASPIERLYFLVKSMNLPRWGCFIKEQTRLISAQKPSIANMAIILLYIVVWASFLILIYKIAKKIDYKKVGHKKIDKMIKYGIMIPLYFVPIPTMIVIGIMKFKLEEEKKKTNVVNSIRKW